MLSEKEKQEWLILANSPEIREDMNYLSSHKHLPFQKAGQIDVDKLIEFLNASNEFMNHRQKPFEPMIDVVMKL